jgi:hypothetical protein
MNHIFYAERICYMAGGLPEYPDLLAESEGTGEIFS